MIEQLSVRDYILFDKADIEFDRDMAVITGETGAGKSLLIDAIGYLMGDRISSDIVRKGREKAVLSMVVSNPSKTAVDLLNEQDIEVEDEIIVTRTITNKGKSKMRINDAPVSLAFARKLFTSMIDVHSQMDTVSLMDPDMQLRLLDQYADDEDLKNETAAAYALYAKASRDLKKAKEETFSDDELEFTTARLNEIADLDPKEGELEELEAKIKEASSLQANLDDYSQASYLLSKDGGIVDSLYEVYRIMDKNDSLTKEAGTVNEMYFGLQAISDDLKSRKDDLLSSSYDLDALQDREYTLKRLYRKYGGSYETLVESKAKLEEKIDRILHKQDVLDKLEAAKKEALVAYSAAAKKLSAKRQSVFKELKEKIEGHAKDLMLEHAVFEIARKPKEAGASGIDDITFMVSMNPGSPLTPLKLSASGGELARLMLALKVVFQSEQGIDTIVFDEIDTGVSGKVALAMGRKMHDLASKYQVLCITHLPSVAVWADEHYYVSKSADADMTSTTIRLLDEQEDLKELAIMASGDASSAAVEGMRQLKEQVRG